MNTPIRKEVLRLSSSILDKEYRYVPRKCVNMQIVRLKVAKLVAEEVLMQLPGQVFGALSGSDIILLTQVQCAIYELDYYGESVYCLDENVISYLWNNIYALIKEVPNHGLLGEELDRLKAYEEFERRIHVGKYPSYLEGLEALEFKCSDITLLKKAAIILSGNRSELSNFDKHRTIAIMREVYDDVSDIIEDIGTYNYNLIHALLKQGRTAGILGELITGSSEKNLSRISLDINLSNAFVKEGMAVFPNGKRGIVSQCCEFR